MSKKYFFDLIIIIIFSPAIFLSFFFIMSIIKIIDGSPIFFSSQRYGRNGKVFDILKFRTLKTNCPLTTSEYFIKLKKNYYTKTGKFLKNTRLDELPQIINVIKGEMSLVGPRPSLLMQKKLIKLRKIKQISILLPGITGLAQINNKYVKNDKDKVFFDQIYLNKKNLLLDLKIIYCTFAMFFKKKFNKKYLF